MRAMLHYYYYFSLILAVSIASSSMIVPDQQENVPINFMLPITQTLSPLEVKLTFQNVTQIFIEDHLPNKECGLYDVHGVELSNQVLVSRAPDYNLQLFVEIEVMGSHSLSQSQLQSIDDGGDFENMKYCVEYGFRNHMLEYMARLDDRVFSLLEMSSSTYQDGREEDNDIKENEFFIIRTTFIAAGITMVVVLSFAALLICNNNRTFGSSGLSNPTPKDIEVHSVAVSEVTGTSGFASFIGSYFNRSRVSFTTEMLPPSIITGSGSDLPYDEEMATRASSRDGDDLSSYFANKTLSSNDFIEKLTNEDDDEHSSTIRALPTVTEEQPQNKDCCVPCEESIDEGEDSKSVPNEEPFNRMILASLSLSTRPSDRFRLSPVVENCDKRSIVSASSPLPPPPPPIPDLVDEDSYLTEDEVVVGNDDDYDVTLHSFYPDDELSSLDDQSTDESSKRRLVRAFSSFTDDDGTSQTVNNKYSPPSNYLEQTLRQRNDCIGDEIIHSATSLHRDGYIKQKSGKYISDDKTYDCIINGGALKIVIDSGEHTDYRPIVHVIKPDSPLRYICEEGDTIMSINGLDTLGMTAGSFAQNVQMVHPCRLTLKSTPVEI